MTSRPLATDKRQEPKIEWLLKSTESSPITSQIFIIPICRSAICSPHKCHIPPFHTTCHSSMITKHVRKRSRNSVKIGTLRHRAHITRKISAYVKPALLKPRLATVANLTHYSLQSRLQRAKTAQVHPCCLPRCPLWTLWPLWL